MVKYKVRLTNYAIKQLENVIDYTLDVLQSPDSALKLADALEQSIQSLDEMPHRTPFTAESHSRCQKHCSPQPQCNSSPVKAHACGQQRG